MSFSNKTDEQLIYTNFTLTFVNFCINISLDDLGYNLVAKKYLRINFFQQIEIFFVQ